MHSLPYVSLFHLVSWWCQEGEVGFLPGDRIAVLREVCLVAGAWAGSSLLQLAVILWRVAGRRVLLGREEAASLSLCQVSKWLCWTWWEDLEGSRVGGMLNFCSNCEELDAAGVVGIFPGIFLVETTCTELFGKCSFCCWQIAVWGCSWGREGSDRGLCCWPADLEGETEGSWDLVRGKVEGRRRVHMPGLSRASGNPVPVWISIASWQLDSESTPKFKHLLSSWQHPITVCLLDPAHKIFIMLSLNV